MGVQSTGQKIQKVVLTIVFWFFGIIMVIPFLWMISAAFKTQAAVYNFPIEWIPKEPTTKAFRLLFKKVPYVTYFLNSVKVAALALIGLAAPQFREELIAGAEKMKIWRKSNKR